MASVLIGALRVDLAMNAGEFMRGSKAARGELNSLGRKFADISAKIHGASILINTGMRAAQRFAAVSRAILGVASAFEQGMGNVGTLIDSATENLDDMSEAVLEVGRRTPVALAELTSGLYDIRSAGIPAADAMKVLERSAKLAVAGLGTTKEAVDLVTSSINAFGLEGEAADQVYDQVFKTVRAGKTTISQLAQGFGAVAGTVANAGIRLDDYLASVAALTTTGLPAAQAHTQIRAAIAGLLRETAETKALFDALNVKTFKELIKQSGSVGVAFERILRATQGNDAQLIKLVGSVEAYNAMVGLAGRQNASYVSTLATMRNGVDSVGEAFDKQDSTVAAATQRLTNNVQALGIAMGNALAPAIKSISDFVEDVTSAFKSLSPEMQEIVAKVAVFVGVIGPAAVAVGFFVNALWTLVPVFTAIGGAVAALIASTGPIGAFVIVAGAAVTAWNIFKDDIIAIWDAVAGYIGDKIDSIIERMKRFAQVIAESFTLITEGEFTAAWKNLGNVFISTADQVNRAAKSGNLAIEEWGATIEELSATAEDFNDGFVMPVGEGLTDLEKLWNRHNEAAQRFGTQVIEGLRDPTEEMIAQQWRLKAALDAGGLSASQFGAAMQKSTFVAANAYAGMASGIADNLAKAFGDSKAFAIAAAIINTAESVTKALAVYGPTPWGFAAAAAAGAAGAAQIAAIKNTNKGGGGGSGGSSSGTAAAGSAAQGAPQQMMTVNLHGQSFGRDQVRGLIEQINDAVSDGAQLIVRAA